MVFIFKQRLFGEFVFKTERIFFLCEDGAMLLSNFVALGSALTLSEKIFSICTHCDPQKKSPNVFFHLSGGARNLVGESQLVQKTTNIVRLLSDQGIKSIPRSHCSILRHFRTKKKKILLQFYSTKVPRQILCRWRTLNCPYNPINIYNV